MGKLEGKVAFITGAARGQGRSHAIRLAQEGADIIAVDICRQIASVPYPMATPDDLAETAKQVEALDRRIFTAPGRRPRRGRPEGGVRRRRRPSSARSTSSSPTRASRRCRCTRASGDAWQDVIDVNLTGVFNTVEIAIPSMIERGQGGAIVLTSSTAGITGIGGADPRRPRLHRRQARRRRPDAVLRQQPRPAAASG